MSITICQSSTRPFQSLNQPWDFVLGWELEEQVDVIGHDPDLDRSSTVALRFSEEEGQEKIGDWLID